MEWIRQCGIDFVHCWYFCRHSQHPCNNWPLEQPMCWINFLYHPKLLHLLHLLYHIQGSKVLRLQVIFDDGHFIGSVVQIFYDGWLRSSGLFKLLHSLERHRKPFTGQKCVYIWRGLIDRWVSRSSRCAAGLCSLQRLLQLHARVVHKTILFVRFLPGQGDHLVLGTGRPYYKDSQLKLKLNYLICLCLLYNTVQINKKLN